MRRAQLRLATINGLSTSDQLEMEHLIGRARALYDGLIALPASDREHRQALWWTIIDIQDRISLLMESSRRQASSA